MGIYNTHYKLVDIIMQNYWVLTRRAAYLPKSVPHVRRSWIYLFKEGDHHQDTKSMCLLNLAGCLGLLLKIKRFDNFNLKKERKERGSNNSSDFKDSA